MDLELEKEERKSFHCVKGEFGYSLPTSLQKRVKDFTLKELGISEADLDGDPDNQKIYLTRLSNWAEGVTLLYKYNPSTSASNAQPAGTKRGPYIKTYERRYHLVEFVIDSWTRDNRSRIDWERVTAEWNEVHPYDRFEKPISLKSLFNKAIREPGIILPFLFNQVAQEMMAFLDRGQPQEVFENYAGKIDQFLSEVTREVTDDSDREDPPYCFFGVIYKYLKLTDKLEANRRRNKIMRTLIVRNITLIGLIFGFVESKKGKHQSTVKEVHNERVNKAKR